MNHPVDPIAAVTDPDPYPYYAGLVAQTPMYRDERLGMWVASSAAAVTDVLTSNACRVRPPGEPVPRALDGTAVGEIFRRLVRMNDGDGHRALKTAVSAALASAIAARVGDAARDWARALCDELRPASTAQVADDLALRLPAYAIASTLGVPEDDVQRVAGWAGDVARCIAPGAAPDVVTRGNAAAENLIDLVRRLLDGRSAGAESSLLAQLAAQAAEAGVEADDIIVANAIGFLTQAYDATAGLIGNTLLALARHEVLRDRLAAESGLLASVVDEVLRHDPSVHNTRRFAARDATVAGQPVCAGDAILVVLAAANRDPAANPLPDRFDVARASPRVFTFGAGAHACPGQVLAKTIAGAAVEALLAAGVDPAPLVGSVTYRPSANTRIPLFASRGGI
jgi:cytochrome P450